MDPSGRGHTAGAAQSAGSHRENLHKQVLRVHAFLDTVKTNKDVLDTGAGERLHQGLENIDLYTQTVVDFENKLEGTTPDKANEMEMEWAQKVKSMCDSGLDAVIAVMKRVTTGRETD